MQYQKNKLGNIKITAIIIIQEYSRRTNYTYRVKISDMLIHLKLKIKMKKKNYERNKTCKTWNNNIKENRIKWWWKIEYEKNHYFYSQLMKNL